jgi:citrate lyase subunit beta/citryl-CoA lyase
MTTPAPVPRVRSALYVPGGRADFLAKADQRGADAVIIDLEDSVAEAVRGKAVAQASEWIAGRSNRLDPVIFVRINAIEVGRLDDDLRAVVHENLTAVIVPKLQSEKDVLHVSEALGYAEGRAGLPLGHVRIWPLLETAMAVTRSFEIATSTPRIGYMGGAAADSGDLAQSVGMRWTAAAKESLFIRSKVLVDVRAARIPNPMSGMVSAIDRPEEVESLAQESLELGYEGMMVIHPTHVPIVNRIFTPTDDEIAEARGIIDALEVAAAEGKAAVTYKGRMIDTAMIQTSQRLIDDYERLTGRKVGGQ